MLHSSRAMPHSLHAMRRSQPATRLSKKVESWPELVPVAESTVVALTIDALRAFGTEPLPGYESALNHACSAEPPPFGMAWYGDRYRDYAIQPGWLAQSLIANAIKEGEGSTKLWALAGRSRQPDVSELIRTHA